MRVPVPTEVAENVRRWRGNAAPVRDAATVVLLRDGTAGVEAYLLVRRGTLAAFGGMTVFPGGRVDPTDVEADVPWYGPDVEGWPLADDPALARGLVCAAVRETFEEAGVLLAGRPGATGEPVVADASPPDWERTRRALEAHEVSLSTVLIREGLVLRADLLRPWARWITPVQEPWRFDTRFFVAALPAGQHTRDVTGEAERAVWMRPADALAAVARRELRMVPPTVVTLTDLAGVGSVADALAASASRSIRPLCPELVVDENGTVWASVDPDGDEDVAVDGAVGGDADGAVHREADGDPAGDGG
jgi:8-oxo-dGTP pyrophosphatase MutT (NUDIX family)